METHRSIAPLTLEALFGPQGIAADDNGDGYPDRLKAGIAVAPGLVDGVLWAQILNLAARLACETTALTPPVVNILDPASAAGPVLVVHRPSTRHGWGAELRRSGRTVHLAGRSAARVADVLHSLAVHSGRPLRRQRAWSSMRIAARGAEAMEAFDRRGRAAGRYRLSPAGPTAEKPGVARFDLLDPAETLYAVPAERPRERELALTIALARPRLSPLVGLALAQAVVQAALEATAVELPLAVFGPGGGGGVVLRVEERPGRGARLCVERGRNANGVIVRAEGNPRSLAGLLLDWVRIGFGAGGPADEGVRRLRGRIEGVLAAIAAGAPPPAPAAAVPVRRRLAWRSETERLIEIVSRVPPGRGAVHGLALISRPGTVRAQVRREIERILRAKGYAPAVVVLNAYKPGLSWLREVVQPALKDIPRLDRVQIAFREFASDQPALEMKSRWLQELYPGPDLLAAAFGLPLERVRLCMRGSLAEAYIVTAWDRDGGRVYQSGFSPRVIRLPYLAGRPELGWVHPCTGGIRLARSGHALLEERLPTDRDLFWRFFQEGILPALESAMADRIRKGVDPPPAFWEEAVFDVRIPETDERLGIGEERVAPMEALHEDIYFVLLEHFRLFAEKHGLPAESQFGRILPRVATSESSGRPQAVFRARPFTMSLKTGASGRDPARIVSIGSQGRRFGIEIEAAPKPSSTAPVKELCRRTRTRSLEAAPAAAEGNFVWWMARPRPPAADRPKARLKPAGSASPLDRLLSARDVERWVQRIGDLPHLRAWQAGSSWQGRPIRAMEAVLSGGGSLVSQSRSRLLKPTLLMNARHHANEVSSTNTALRLAWELALTRWGRETLKRVNVAIVPLENTDGAATLEELLPGCEGHKLHAARYNALGVEWYGDYFQEAPRFPEARVKPLLWRRWMPLLVLDAHGVPSHEWDQPFSGYAPGRFRSYWIPRALVYAILPFVDEPSHPGHGPAREISRVMARAIRTEPELLNLDRELKDRYRRYARSWEKDVFPPTGGKGLTVLPSERRLAGLNFGVQRFPVTLSEIVTEVTDEVVSGRLLGLCARAHLTVAKALLEWLGRQAPGRLVRTQSRGGGLLMCWVPGKRDRKRQ